MPVSDHSDLNFKSLNELRTLQCSASDYKLKIMDSLMQYVTEENENHDVTLLKAIHGVITDRINAIKAAIAVRDELSSPLGMPPPTSSRVLRHGQHISQRGTFPTTTFAMRNENEQSPSQADQAGVLQRYPFDGREVAVVHRRAIDIHRDPLEWQENPVPHGMARIERNRVVLGEISIPEPAHQRAIVSAGHKRSANDMEITESQVNKVPKKIEVVASSTALSTSASTINSNTADRIFLTDLGGRHRANISLPPTDDERLVNYSSTSSSASSDPPTSPNCDVDYPPVDYPPISDALEILHRVISDFDLLQYSSALSNHCITTVDDIRYASDDLLAAIGMPEGIHDMFRDYAMRMALCAEGGGVSAPRYY